MVSRRPLWVYTRVVRIRAAAIIGVFASGLVVQAKQATLRTNIVDVDVRATGGDGKIVRDLTVKDFEIKEDGKRQEISAISMVDLQDEQRRYVLILDDLHVTAAWSARVMRVATEFIDRHLEERDVMAVRLTGNTGPSTPFTGDKAILKAAVTKFVGRKALPSSQDEADRRGRGGDARPVMQALRESSESLRDSRGRRRAIILISEGLDDAGDVQAVIRSANETHSSVYAIDPRGVSLFEAADITGPSVDPDNTADMPVPSSAPAAPQANAQNALRSLAESTGGAFITQSNLASAYARIVDDTTTYYVVSYAPAANPKPGFHKTEVKVKRRGVQVRARAGYFAPLSKPAPAVTTAAASPKGVSPTAGAASTNPAAFEALPPVDAPPASELVPPVPVEDEIKDEASVASMPVVLTRLAKYVTDYQTRLGGIVVEESYRQQVTAQSVPGRGMAVPAAVELKSDLLLVRPEGEQRWIQFRDVFQVDGKTIRDRDERLMKLFVKPTGTSEEQALAIQNEGSRYNVGSIVRTVNVPILALSFFDAEHQSRFTFKRIKPGDVREFAGSAKTDDVWAFEYKEVSKQTLVRGNNNADMPSRGRIWVEGTTGRVLKTELLLDDIQIKAAITVDYAFAPELNLLVPSEMRERYQMNRSASRIEATANYSKFRQFKVTTTEKTNTETKKPPPE